MAAGRKLLVIDTSYTYEMVRERGLERSVTCRDLGGFFDHVWTVHPFATMLTSEGWAPRYGRPVVHEIDGRHSFVEGKVGRFAALRRVFPLNFLLGQLGLFLMLRRLIRREGVSVIRTGNPLYIGLLAWALSRATGVPFVIRVGGNHDKLFETTGEPMEPRLMRSRAFEKKVERFVFRRADLVAGANADNLQFALDNGARPERSTLFRYGNLIDEGHFVPPAERALDPRLLDEFGLGQRPFLVYIGRLEALKHPDDVIRVVAELKRRGRDVAGLLVGDGRMRAELEAFAEAEGVSDRIFLPGNRSQGWLAQVAAQAAAIVSPHTGRALSEAALAAAPIAAYDLDWQGELIEDGVTGALVPHREWRGLADAVERYLADPDHARRMGEAVRERALAMLDPAALDQHERDEYAKLIARGRR